MSNRKFDAKKLQKLNNPQRLKDIPPQIISNRLINKNPRTLIEIGAGTAFFCIAFLQHCKPDSIYACDLSATMIDWMQENVAPKYPAIIPVKTDEDRIPLAGAAADLLFMINLHHELEQPEKSLHEAYRLLKPGGEIFIVDWKKQGMPEGPPEEIRCTTEEVKNQLQKTGFKQLRVCDDLAKHFLLVGQKD
ncbi:Methyltransferase domain-containing protein [Malonomonas rubra DSM 5091]|uniref:Methyltransferase domain-containing protein n=1 Tax=Malonomonas rubra DSM 5091 TaxID=1122189 RepID=A0A1M6IXR5_MALRU|nr:class I SAM-dependent methyltransferase [Malonomonas rubra]SHJ39226.1 Methyltransferase domain-containing protein [Malonomonas rubra DSM 5091]